MTLPSPVCATAKTAQAGGSRGQRKRYPGKQVRERHHGVRHPVRPIVQGRTMNDRTERNDETDYMASTTPPDGKDGEERMAVKEGCLR